MLNDKQEAQILAELSAINSRGDQLYKDDFALKDEVEKVKDTDVVEYTSYQKLKKEWEEGVEYIKGVVNSAEIKEIADNVQKAVESSKDKADVREIDSALYIDGIIKITDALAVTKFSKEAYERGSLGNPFRLKANIRIHAEKQVETLQNLLVNSIPLSKEIIQKLDPRQAMEAFKGVVLNSFDELEELQKTHPHIEAVKKHMALKDCFVKFVAYPLEMSNIYCSALDLNLPIDRGLIDWQDKQLATIKENQKTIDGQADKVALLNRQNTVNEDTIKVQQQQIANNQAKINLQEETEKALDLRIAAKQKKADSEEGEGDEEGEENED